MKLAKPADPLGYYYQAAAYDKRGAGREVVQNLQFVKDYMETHPGRFQIPVGELYHNIGLGYFRQGDMANAIKFFEMSLKEKEDAQGLYMLGLSYEQINDFRKAREFYERCSKLSDPEQMEWINRAIGKLGSPKFAKEGVRE